MKSRLLLLAGFSLLANSATAVDFMLGDISYDRASVWIKDGDGSGTLLSGGKEVALGATVSYPSNAVVSTWTNLQPQMDYQVLCAGEKIAFRTPAKPGRTGRVVFAVGSCCHLATPTNRAPLFDAIANAKPELLLWMGDNWYSLGPDNKNTSARLGKELMQGDWSDEHLMRRRALSSRLHPDLRRPLREMANYAIWDDHDFGFNNAPADGGKLLPEDAKKIWMGREKALDVFKGMWANPAYGLPEKKLRGVFYTFRRGPAAFFMMDDRYYKDPRQDRTWGQGQMTWLMDQLTQAELDGVPAKFIVNGTQVIAKTGPEAHTAEAKGELIQLREFIRSQEIRNVFILSGDRHRSEMWVDGPGTNQLVEFTASPFAHPMIREPSAADPNRVWVAPAEPTYGLITVDVATRGAGTVTMEVRNARNQVPLNRAAGLSPTGAPCRVTVDLAARTLAPGS